MLAVKPPSAKPLQLALLSNTMVMMGPAVMVAEATLVHPLLSVMVAVYVPANTPVMLAVVAPLLHR